ncbi:DUF7344 domain-containing protein [Natronosalvus halobius]|uniref:DUF7344 domain-containing protein n=1 Tax=Natronosalvus halobius TaxID=2953746 RepID=UPI0020A1F270|nr:hypothetical protein [Natronosalvus halobius]USZ71835.1 hypothetical protein NGM15_00565 [Natronosalvus halobius]
MSPGQSAPSNPAVAVGEVSATDGRRSGDSPPSLPPDDRYHILQTRRRRDTLRYLRRCDGPVDARELAEWVAAREQETTPEMLTSRQRQRVYISLYQTHLPKLDEYGIVRYHKDRGAVTPLALVEHFDEYLAPSELESEPGDEDEDEDTRAWWRPYLALSSLGVALIGLSAGGVLPLPALAITGLVVSSFATLSVFHALVATGWTEGLDLAAVTTRIGR